MASLVQVIYSPLNVNRHDLTQTGKTVLASLVIDEAEKLADTKVIYFYCRSDQQRQYFTSMARSFLRQLLRLDDSILIDLYEAATSDGDSGLNTRKSAERILEICFNDVGRTYIIIDGLDECPDPEQKAIVAWLRKFVDSSSSNTEPSRCVVFSQYDASTKTLLSTIPSLEILPNDIQADINIFCINRSTEIASKFGLDASEAAQIALTTSERANGKSEDAGP